MKTRSLVVGCVLLAFASSAFAGSSSSQSNTGIIKRGGRMCLTIVGSSIPQPCDRFTGPVPTTHFPVDIYGRRVR
jgi:hypothetical protein